MHAITNAGPHDHSENTTGIENSKYASPVYANTCDAGRKANGDSIACQRNANGRANHSRRNRCQLELRPRGVENVSESEVAGRGTTRNWHVQKPIVPVLY
jgi:hypothetical protein